MSAQNAMTQEVTMDNQTIGTAGERGPEGVTMTPLQRKRRGQRNLAIGIALFAIVGLFYLMTLVKLGVGAHH